jgi:hypothetical protein
MLHNGQRRVQDRRWAARHQHAQLLRRTLCCTNVIESAFSIVEAVCRNVKRWRPGDQIERWVGSGLLVAERQFRRAIGHHQIPLLLSSMANAVSKKPIAKGAAVA